MYPTHVYAYVGLPINNPDQPSTCYAEQMNQLRVGRNVLGLKLSLAFQKRETTDDRNFRDSSFKQKSVSLVSVFISSSVKFLSLKY